MKEKMKWLYTFVLLFITVGWAIFTVMIVKSALAEPSMLGVIEASGTSVLLGAFLTWNANVNKHWFGGEKKPPEETPPSP